MATPHGVKEQDTKKKTTTKKKQKEAPLVSGSRGEKRRENN